MALMKNSKFDPLSKTCSHIDIICDHEISQSKSNESTEFQENWISDFIFNNKFGICINFGCICISIIYLVYRLLMNDDFIKLLIQNVYSPNLQTAYLAISLEVLMHLVILLILLPMSKYCKSTLTKCLLAIICSIIILVIGFCDMNGNYLTELGRTMISIESIRMQLKLISYLVECNKYDDLCSKSNVTNVLYFLFAPTLIYRINYDRARRVRWFRILCYLIWLTLVSTLFIGLFYEIMIPYLVFDVKNASISIFILNIIANALFFLIFYIFIVTFIFFEVWCGFWAEILLFADHKFFGPYIKYTFDTQFIADLNIIVSTWIRIYLFKPVLDISKSLYFAFIVTFTLSMLYHEMVYSYVLGQILPLALLWGPILATYFYIIRFNFCHQIMMIVLGIFGIFVYAYPHTLEFSARKYCSTDVNITFRLIPLFVTCLQNKLIQAETIDSETWSFHL